MKERRLLLLLGTGGVLLTLALFIIALPLLANSYQALLEKGWEILTSMDWNPMQGHFGGLQFILGSLWVTFWSTLLSIPLALSLAILATDLAPRRLKGIVSGFIDLIAAIPSVVYGYWGLMILGPLLASTLYPALQQTFSRVPLLSELFSTSAITPQCFMTAVIVLALMVTPYASAVIRNSYEMVPKDMIEAVYALGGDKWEAIKMSISYIKSSIIAGVVIAAGRALGETMAVTMLIGNSVQPFRPCLLCRGATITSIVVNEFEEAMMNPMHSQALTALILILIAMGSVLLYLGRKVSKELVEAEIHA